MPVSITREAALNILKNSGFAYAGKEGGITQVKYKSDIGFTMSFAVQWLDCGFDAKFDLAEVRKMVATMLENVRMEETVYRFLKTKGNREKIDRACSEYGMVRSQPDDGQWYYVVDGSALFGVDADYLASLVCTGKADLGKLADTLDAMKDSAEHEAALRKLSEGVGIKNFKKSG